MLPNLLYLFAIIGVNFGFSMLPVWNLPWFGPVPAMCLFVGLVFVLRDFAQRRAGHWVLLTMALGCIASYFLADPKIAIISAVAFAVSEVIDYSVYTMTSHRSFGDRILLSSAIAVPVDTVFFLAGLGFLTLGSAVAMSLGKFIAALIVWGLYKLDEWDQKHGDALNEMLENRSIHDY